ncbi:MAG TPA: hypothetical protein VJM69_01930, partial [Dehalococcoidia bacterium]|nr:hypothetical protein [Dehalococcoidia bacterium]
MAHEKTGSPESSLKSKLSSLSPSCRELLRIAAVLGYRFSSSWLWQMTKGLTLMDVLEGLEEAKKARVVESSADPDTFHFAQSLLRELMYEEIELPQRLNFHKLAAKALQGMGLPTPQREVEIAHHLLQAGPLAEPHEVLEACWRAGRLCLAHHACGEAAYYLTAALERAERAGASEAYPQLLAEAGLALGLAGYKAGLPRLRQAILLHRGEGAVQAKLWEARLVELWGRFKELDSLNLAEELEGGPKSEALALWGTSLMIQGQLSLARRALEEAWTLAQRHGDPAQRASVLLHLALSHVHGLGEDGRAIAALREAQALCQELQDPLEGAQVGIWGGIALYWLGRVEEARQALKEVGALPAGHLSPFLKADLATSRALTWVHQGELDLARSALEEAQAHKERLGTFPHQHLLTRVAALIELWEGQIDGAWACLEEAEPVTVFSLFALLAALKGQGQEVHRLCRETAGKLARSEMGGFWLFKALPMVSALCTLGLKEEAGRYYPLLLPYRHRLTDWHLPELEMGRIAALNQWWERAEEHFRRAIQFCEKHSLRPFLSLSLAEYGRALLSRGRPGDAAKGRVLMEKARASAPEGAQGPLFPPPIRPKG